jgi:hypothetical protein
MNTLPMAGKGAYFNVMEILSYNNLKNEGQNYQQMAIAVKQLADTHKLIKKRKLGERGIQYEYCLPTDIPTKIVLNGDLVEQQRRV